MKNLIFQVTISVSGDMKQEKVKIYTYSIKLYIFNNSSVML